MRDKPKLKSALSKEERALALLENQKANESIFKLTVKIICWQTGALGSQVVQTSDKITPVEWQKYKKHRLKTFNITDIEKAKKEIAQTYESIKANGGFA